MVRPVQDVSWATTTINNGSENTPNKVEPTASKKSLGWDFPEKPPRSEFNWWQNAAGEWINYLEDSKALTHSSYQDMLDDGGLQVGQVIITKSYHDGLGKGGGIYEVIASAFTADNFIYGDTVGGLQVKLVSDVKNAYQAGAAGDGPTDDTVRIQVYIDAQQDTILNFPIGVFGISADLSLNPGQIVQGVTLCSSLGNTDGTVFKAISGGGFTNGMIVMSAHTAVRNIKFDGNSIAGRAIKLGASTDGFVNLVDENRFTGFTGVTIQGNTPDSVVIRNNEFNDVGTGSIRAIEGSLVQIIDNRFVPSENIDFCIDIQSSLNNSEGRIVGNLFEGSNNGVDLSDFVDAIILTGANNLTIESNNFQMNPASTVHNSHILIKTGATRTNIGKNNYQNKGATANDIQIDSGALGAYILNDDLAYSVGAGLDISDAGTGTTAEIYESSINSFIKLFNTWNLGALTGGIQFTFDTSSGRIIFDDVANRYIDGTSGDDLTLSADAGEQIRLENADRTVCEMPFRAVRLTTTERDALTPNEADIIYNTTTNKHQGYNGSTWNDFY